ncbi:MAG: Hsp70 family protein [Spirochaetota bacterium]
MDKGKIGIKVADGSFYPILDEGVAQKKRLVLTTVKDNQESVQIDLYKGSGEAMEDAAYIGSLLVENIAPDAQGNAEIDLVVGVDEGGNLESVAEDKQSGSKQSLSVGLQNLDESGLYEVPDFSFEEEGTELEDIFGEETEDVFSEESDFTEISEEDFSEPDFETDFDTEESDELSTLEEETGEGGEEDFFPPEEAVEAELGEEETEGEIEEEAEEEAEEESRSKVRPILVALLVILALALIGALLYLFVFMAADEEATPQLQARQEQEQAQEQPSDETAEEQPELSETRTRAEEPAGEGAEAQPSAGVDKGEGETVVTSSRDQVEFTGGVWYKIRWGDTLWEISSSFYDNPWLYDQIAKENEIRNPDVIYAENSIFIPKKK